MQSQKLITANRIVTLHALRIVLSLFAVIFCCVSVYQTLAKNHEPAIIFGILSVGFTFMALWNSQIESLSKKYNASHD